MNEQVVVFGFGQDWVRVHVASRPDRRPLQKQGTLSDSGQDERNDQHAGDHRGSALSAVVEDPAADVEIGDEEPR